MLITLIILKKIVEALRKSWALKFKYKHKYTSLYKVYTIYGLGIKIIKVVLYPIMKVLNCIKRFTVTSKKK